MFIYFRIEIFIYNLLLIFVMGKKRLGEYLVHVVLIFLILLYYIQMNFSFKGKIFWLELFGFFVLIFIALVGILYFVATQRNGIFLFFYALGLINLVLIWSVSKNFYMVLTIVLVFGCIFSILFSKRRSDQRTLEDDFEIMPPPRPPKDIKKAIKKVVEDEYVASKSGKKFHKPSCDWANRINKENKIKLTEEEAKERGLKACDCVNE